MDLPQEDDIPQFPLLTMGGRITTESDMEDIQEMDLYMYISSWLSMLLTILPSFHRVTNRGSAQTGRRVSTLLILASCFAKEEGMLCPSFIPFQYI